MTWLIAAGIWGFAEGTLFFIVPDVLLSALALSNLRRALLACLFATAGAMIGGALMFWWGDAHPEAAAGIVAGVPAVGADMMARAHEDMLRMGAVATIFGPLTATPYKVYASQAASAGIPFAVFMLVTPIARLPRFLLVSLLAGGIARWLEPRVSRRLLYGIWAAAWLAVYAVLWGAFTASRG
jgi:membrane protein YqaA with SNARE-associated domain